MRTLLLLLIAAPPASAGGGRNPFKEPDESEFFKLDDKLLTVASRYAQSERKAPNIVTLIDAETIRDRGYRTLGDALRDLPGIYSFLSREGRELASFRGVVSTDNNKILLLVDGVPWYDGVYTHAWVDDYLPIHHVKQIEVIKGPGSAVYGTNAFAGVINVVTFSAEELKGGRARVMGGSRSRLDASVIAGDTDEIAGIPVSATAYARYFRSDGQAPDFTPRDRPNLGGEDPRRGLAVGTHVAVGGLKAQLHHIDFRHKYLTSEEEDLFSIIGGDIDMFGLNYHATIMDLRYDAEPTRGLRITPRIWSQRHDNPGMYAYWGFGRTESGAVDTTSITIVDTQKDTRQWGTSLDTEIRPHPDHVTVGGIGFDSITVLDLRDSEYRDFDRTREDTAFRAPTGARLRNLYGFASHTWTVSSAIELTAGGRLDRRIPSNPTDEPDADAFRLFVSPRAGVLINPTPTVNLKFLYGRAFRHASVRETLVRNELGPDGLYPFSNGNLNLRPEQVDTVDAEMTVQPDEQLTVRLAGSYSRIDYEIDKISPPNQYMNIEGGLDIATAEVEAIGEAGPATLRLAYAFTLARYGAIGPYADRMQFEFPPHMVKGNLTLRATDRLSSTLTGEAYSSRPRAVWTPDAQLSDGRPFGLLHLAVRMARLGKGKHFDIVGSVRNLTDTTFDTAISRDEINRVQGDPNDPVPRYPLQIGGFGRSFHVAVEARL